MIQRPLTIPDPRIVDTCPTCKTGWACVIKPIAYCRCGAPICGECVAADAAHICSEDDCLVIECSDCMANLPAEGWLCDAHLAKLFEDTLRNMSEAEWLAVREVA